MLKELFDAIEQHDLDEVSSLLSQGADVNLAQDEPPSWRPLGFAIEELEFGGSIEIVRLLVKHGADVNAFYVDSKLTSLHAAIFNGDIEVIRLILEAGGDPNIVDNEDYLPLQFAVQQNSLEIAKLLLQYGAGRTINESGGFCGDTALGVAIRELNVPMIELLLDHGADPEALDSDDQMARENLPPREESDSESWNATVELLWRHRQEQ